LSKPNETDWFDNVVRRLISSHSRLEETVGFNVSRPNPSHFKLDKAVGIIVRRTRLIPSFESFYSKHKTDESRDVGEPEPLHSTTNSKDFLY